MSRSWLCVDASLVVRLITDTDTESWSPLWNTWLARGHSLAAPTLLHYEVINAVYQYHRHGLMSPATLELAQATLFALPLRLFGDTLLHRRAVELALQLALPATYDAHYLALADTLGAELWTCDRQLVRSASSLDWVKLAERPA